MEDRRPTLMKGILNYSERPNMSRYTIDDIDNLSNKEGSHRRNESLEQPKTGDGVHTPVVQIEVETKMIYDSNIIEQSNATTGHGHSD